jgi:4-methyl-5(b-hydroxyethyl)-thiazole monophosphate biosynthesis
MKRVLLLLAEGYETFEASVFIDVIGWNLADGDGTTELFTCGLRKQLQTSFKQQVIVDYLVDDINVDDFDALAIPGGFEVYGFYNDAYNDRFLHLIRRFKAANKIIASICVGALPVAKSGILTNKKGTTYNNPVRRGELRDFGVTVLDQPIVVDDNIITSWNPSTAIDVALLLLEMLTSKNQAGYIRQIMGFGNK